MRDIQQVCTHAAYYSTGLQESSIQALLRISGCVSSHNILYIILQRIVACGTNELPLKILTFVPTNPSCTVSYTYLYALVVCLLITVGILTWFLFKRLYNNYYFSTSLRERHRQRFNCFLRKKCVWITVFFIMIIITTQAAGFF